jgi:hypothetical protein
MGLDAEFYRSGGASVSLRNHRDFQMLLFDANEAIDGTDSGIIPVTGALLDELAAQIDEGGAVAASEIPEGFLDDEPEQEWEHIVPFYLALIARLRADLNDGQTLAYGFNC